MSSVTGAEKDLLVTNEDISNSRMLFFSPEALNYMYMDAWLMLLKALRFWKEL